MKKNEIHFLVLFSILSLFSIENVSANTKIHMQDIAKHYVEITKKMNFAESSDKNLQKSLKKLEEAIHKLNGQKMLENPLFKLTKNKISRYISEINSNFDQSSVVYNKYRMSRMASLCISCHTQLPSSSFPPIKNKEYLEMAELNSWEDSVHLAYLYRDYEEASEILNEEIRKGLQKTKGLDYLQRELGEIIKINLTFLDRPKKIVKLLSDYEKITKDQKLVSFLDMAKEEINKTNFKKNSISLSSLIELLKKDEQELIEQVYVVNGAQSVSFAISNRLVTTLLANESDKKAQAKLLYWKGLLENQSDVITFHSFGNSFLRECIETYPKSVIAHKCFRAYKYSVEMGFTGSAGKHVPSEVQELLAKLEGIAKPKTEKPKKIKRKLNYRL